MRRNFGLYPKNKISTSTAMFQLPLKNISYSSEKNIFNNDTIARTAFPKSKKIKKLIEEINLKNPRPIKIKNEANNLYICQKLLREEQLKNKNYYENIIQLNKVIDELEFKLKTNCQNYQNCINVNDELIKLRKENDELKLFKERVYNFSMKYDELNKDILDCLKSIEKIIEIFNMDNYSFSVDNKNCNLNEMSENFKSIINDLTDFIAVKQEEYNTLLKEKENEIEKIKREYISNVEFYSNGFKSCKNFGENTYKSFDYTNYNKIHEYGKKSKTNTYNKNLKNKDFENENSKRNVDYKSTFNDF